MRNWLNRDGLATYSTTQLTHILQMQTVHLDVVFCSSEDDRFPITNLQTRCFPTAVGTSVSSTTSQVHVPDGDEPPAIETGSELQRSCLLLPPMLHADGWESEKFCEYPQELVFRVNRGIPTRLDSLHILSHHAKVPTRIEVFTSTDPGQIRLGEQCDSVEFHRLGYVAFQSNTTTDFSARELKIVQLQSREKITLVRLVLHRCHTNNKHNLFQQVGLLSVIASETSSSLPSPRRHFVSYRHNNVSWSPGRTIASSGILPPLQSYVAASTSGVANDMNRSDHLFSSSLSPLRAKYTGANGRDELKKVVSAPVMGSTSLKHHLNDFESNYSDGSIDNSSSTVYEVWIPEIREFMTPVQISEQIGIRYEDALNSRNGELVQQWKYRRLECRHLSNKLDILQRTFDATSHLLADENDRAAMHEEIELVVQEFGALGSKVFESEMLVPLAQRTWEQSGSAYSGSEFDSTSSGPRDAISIFQTFSDLPKCLQSTSWEAKEETVWKLVEYLRTKMKERAIQIRENPSTQSFQYGEILSVVKQVLRETHSQVFLAACSLLHELLRSTVSFQSREPVFGKSELEEILDALLTRLDDRQGVIRNNAAFAVLKVAELTRPGGTFVMHLILKRLEERQLDVTDQVLHAVLKLFTALLLSFHCCATQDIAPKRVLRFLAQYDGDLHVNPHIRGATRQLTTVMYSEVGASAMQSYLSELPVEVQEMYQIQFKIMNEKKAAAAAVAMRVDPIKSVVETASRGAADQCS